MCFFIAISSVKLIEGGQMDISDYKNPNVPIEKRVEDLLSKMTLDEKIAQLSGKDFMSTRTNKRLSIPTLKMTDGPHGVRCGKATCFPTGITMASTWNRNLIENIAKALGQETKAKGRQILLGPCVNIHRNPLGGRNFESFSEDPYLAGQLAASYITGLQSENVAASLKHYLANNQEYQRTTISAEIDERTLREIYLRTFEIAVKQAHPLSLMAAYNKINGDHACANKHLLTDVLKEEWGFKGFVVSDWGATHSVVKSANAGLDLEMPGPGEHFDEDLKRAVQKGKVSEKTIDDKVRRILTVEFLLGLFDDKNKNDTAALNTKEHQQLAYQAASEGIVLLKNKMRILPFDENKIKSLAVIGPNADTARLGGGGSSQVTPFYSVSAYEGLKRKCKDKIEIKLARGCLMPGGLSMITDDVLSTKLKNGKPGLKAEYFNNINFQGKPIVSKIDKKIKFSWRGNSPSPKINNDNFSARWTGILTPKQSGHYKIGTISDDGSRVYLNGKLIVDNWGDHGAKTEKVNIYLKKGVNYDLKVEYYEKEGTSLMELGWLLPKNTLLEEAVAVAKSADVAVVFVGLSWKIEGEELDRQTFSLPDGQDELIKEIAKANRNTVVVLINGTPVDMSGWIDKVPAVIEAWYPGQEGGNAIADILFGTVNPSGKLPCTLPKKYEDIASSTNYPGKNGKVHYEEGIFIGYRHFDEDNIEPLFPFGFGLSYTDFKYSNLKVQPFEDSEGSLYKVSLDIENIGKKKGKEAVQLYVSDLDSSLPRPPKELKGFRKLSLNPQQKKTVSFFLDSRSLAYYDPLKEKWVVEKGKFKVLVGSSSRDIRLQQTFNVK
jgi:beta-glucosidase